MSKADELAAVNAAITAITEGAQEYQIGTRKVKRPDLAALYRERKDLESQIAAANGLNVTVAYFDRR